MRRFVLAAVALFLVPAAIATGLVLAGSESATLEKKIPIGEDATGRGWKLGGFSGLYPLDSSGKSFLALTDRGPNGDLTCEGVAGKEIFVPAFAPRLIQFGVRDRKIHVKKATPLSVGTQLATGLPNLSSATPTTSPTEEQAFATGCAKLEPDPFGVDSEGIVPDLRGFVSGLLPWPLGGGGRLGEGAGLYWLADEYRPSILHVAPDGEILSRLVPKDALHAYANAVAAAEADSGNSLNVIEAFPEVIGRQFRRNRGFEDVAISRSGWRTYLYTGLQSPMENPFSVSPSSRTRRSLAIRFFRIDVTNPASPVVDREWLYLLEKDPGANQPLADKISALWWIGPETLLVEERDDPDFGGFPPSVTWTKTTKLFKVDFSQATNLLGSTWDSLPNASTPAASTTPACAATPNCTLEQWRIPPNAGPAGVTPGSKTECVNLTSELQALGIGKVEGIAVLPGGGSRWQVVAVNDNDFDLEVFTNPAGRPPIATKLALIDVPSC